MNQVKEQYSSDLDIALSTIGEKYGKNYIELSLEYKNILKDLIIKNEFKHVIIQNEDEKRGNSDLKKQSIDWILQPAYASHNSCASQSDVRYFKQVHADISGQANFEGDNDLESVVKTTMSDCSVKYTLTFTDEDHPIPWIDSWYDDIRMDVYGRITDIETFYVDDDQIEFIGVWSDEQTFYKLIPLHYTSEMSFQNTVYVSNTWNHMMSTEDTNPSMWKTTHVF